MTDRLRVLAPGHDEAQRPGGPERPAEAMSPAQETMLRLQRSSGNAAVTRLLRQPKQPPPAAPPKRLTPKAAEKAATAVASRYDEDSIRLIESLANVPPDGKFTAADAEALAQEQAAKGKPATGTVNEAYLSFLLPKVTTVAARSALIHLVVDHANLDVSGVLDVRHDPLTQGSAVTSVFGSGVATILLGDAAFVSYQKMVAAIKKQITAAGKLKGVPATAVPAGVLSDPKAQADAIAFNKSKLADRRSIRIVQGAIGSNVTGSWDVDAVRHIAVKQKTVRPTTDGKLDELTLEAIVTQLLTSLEQDAVLQLIIDYYDLDRSHAFSVFHDASFTAPAGRDAHAEVTRPFQNFGTGAVVRFGPSTFTQPFAGIVHSVAHELEHVAQGIQGLQTEATREFLAEAVEIISAGMPQESIESATELDEAKNKQPTTQRFIKDAASAIVHWNNMPKAERLAIGVRFKQVRHVVLNRINREAGPAQKTRLKDLVQAWKTAPDAPP